MDRTRSTAPGPDNVHYQILKHMQDEAKEYLLRVYNRLWKDGHFPREWGQATVVAFHKPEKNQNQKTTGQSLVI